MSDFFWNFNNPHLAVLHQHRMLYVFDPKALHHVILKDADVYDLPEWSME